MSTKESNQLLREQIVACLRECGKLSDDMLRDELDRTYSRVGMRFDHLALDGQLKYLVMTKQICTKIDDEDWGEPHYWLPPKPKEVNKTKPLFDEVIR